ncbi:MAG: CBS domain-containing protein, partial [Candidatus Methanoperedens sp.]|nr:CBS domain-containing protein [Candidatus Methanoperedens sp.]
VSKNGRLAGIISVEDIMHNVGEKVDLNIAVDEAMHSPQITIESDKWLADAIAMFKRPEVSHIAVVEQGDKVGIIRVDDILHTYKFNEEGQN